MVQRHNSHPLWLLIAILTAVAAVHVGAAVAAYSLIQMIAPQWLAFLVAFSLYWVLRNVLVVRLASWVRPQFRALGDYHRSVGIRLPRVFRFAMPYTFHIYADPLGAYDGLVHVFDIMSAVDTQRRGEEPQQTSSSEAPGSSSTKPPQ